MLFVTSRTLVVCWNTSTSPVFFPQTRFSEKTFSPESSENVFLFDSAASLSAAPEAKFSEMKREVGVSIVVLKMTFDQDSACFRFL